MNGHYGLGVGVTALADLVVKAMRLPGDKATIEHLITAKVTETTDKTVEKV